MGGRRKREVLGPTGATGESGPPAQVGQGPLGPEPGQPDLDTGTAPPQSISPRVAKAEADRVARETFLVSLRVGNTVSRAAKDAGVSRSTVHRWRDSLDHFGKDWDEAVKEGDEAVIQEIHRRSVEGVLRPVTVAGVREMVLQFSDVLLIVYAKMRGIFRENMVVEHKGKMEIRDPRAELLQILENRSKIKVPGVADPSRN